MSGADAGPGSDPRGVPSACVLAGGGTAGHTSPLIATAHELSRLSPGRPLDRARHAPRPGDHGGAGRRAAAGADPAGADAAPARQGPRCWCRSGCPGRSEAAAGCCARVAGRRRARLRRLRVDPGLPGRAAARAADRHPRAERPARSGQPAGCPVHLHVYTSFPDTPLPHASCIGLPLRRGITELDRAGGAAGGPGGLRPARRPAGAAGQRRVAGRGQHQQGGARRPRPRCWPRGIQVLHALGPKNLTDDLTRRSTSTPARSTARSPTSSRWSRRTPPPT